MNLFFSFQNKTFKNDQNLLKDKILQERIPDILPPNETYEQQQLYYYANKFWPFKQRALFPIDDVISSKTYNYNNII